MNILFSTDYIIADPLFDRQIFVATVLLKIVSRYMYRISWVYRGTYFYREQQVLFHIYSHVNKNDNWFPKF